MNVFQTAYEDWHEAYRAAVYPRNLEYRVMNRYRLAERFDDPQVIALCDRLNDRLEAGRVAEYAESDALGYLNAMWARYSRHAALQPLGGMMMRAAVYDRGWP